MPLISSALASLIQSNLQAAEAKGPNLQIFCQAIAQGITMSIVDKTFTTTDTGLVIGIGAGTGTGIQGLAPPLMVSTAISAMSSTGPNAVPLMNAIMNAVTTYLGTAATLTTVDNPVYSGTGIVNVGSITVVASEMGSNIDSQLQAVGAMGVNRTQLAMAIADGVCAGILSSGTGTVNITPVSIILPSGSGSGTGTGTIS